MNELDQKKQFLIRCIKQYIKKYNEKNLHRKVFELESLIESIKMSYCDKSIEKVNHLYKIRIEIEKHIINNNFNKNYKKLNEKFVYNIDKCINHIYDTTCFINGIKHQLKIFNSEDLECFGRITDLSKHTNN